MTTPKKCNEYGQEIVDQTPVEVPAGLRRPETLTEKVRRMIVEQTRVIAETQGRESFEEADDFDVGDDYDPRSPHELSLDQELEPRLSRKQIDHELRIHQERVKKLKEMRKDGVAKSVVGDTKHNPTGPSGKDGIEAKEPKEGA